MNYLKLIQRTPRRVIAAFVFSYLSVLLATAVSSLKTSQMFWQ